MQHPLKKKGRGLWIVLGIIGVLLFACIGTLAFAGKGATTTVVPTQAPTKGHTMPKSIATNVPALTHGTPHIGGPISDFYGKYGTPNNQGIGGSQTWIASRAEPVLVNATANGRGTVTRVMVTTAADWTSSQTTVYCSKYLPPDASKFNSVSDLTDYHSSVGEIVMQIAPASGVLSLSQS